MAYVPPGPPPSPEEDPTSLPVGKSERVGGMPDLGDLDGDDGAGYVEREVPALPEGATVEEREEHWYRHVYQGDRVKQLTLRAVLMGGVIGMFMSLSNLYTTLKLGWAFGVAITACVLSYVIWNALRALTGGRLSQMTILESNCMQSTASAAGYSTGGTVGTAFGALLLITAEHVSWKILTPFVLLTAALGVFLAIPMKRQMINVEQLTFPSGVAAAVTLRSLYSRGQEAVRKAYSLVIALGLGAVIGLLRSYGTLVDQFKNVGRPQEWLEDIHRALHIPELLAFPMRVGPQRAQMAGFGFEPSVLLIGAGMIVGLRVSLSMLLGSALLYFWIAPELLARDAAMAGQEGFVPSFTLALTPDGPFFNPTRWALWGGTAVMVFSSLTSVAVQWRTIARAFGRLGGGQEVARGPAGMKGVEVPFTWFIAGVIPIGIGLVIVQKMAFDMSILLGTIAVLMSFVVALVCCRATGETDTTPIGAMGKVTQLLYAVLAKGNTPVNLMSAGVTAAAGGSAADLLTDLKSGYLLGANARKQFLAQFIGVFFGTLAIVPAWYLMVPDKAALEAFNPPAANMWRAVAEALTEGLHTVPMTAQYAIVIGALVGIALPLLATVAPRSARYLPSAMGLGLAWVVPFQNSLSFAVGAVIAWMWSTASKRSSETYVIPVASGLVAGESLISALIAISATLVGLGVTYGWW